MKNKKVLVVAIFVIASIAGAISVLGFKGNVKQSLLIFPHLR
jgi:hypothetical protein